VATCLGIQDFSQLRKDYGKEQADLIMNIAGNIIIGQVTGDTAKQLSERFGKIMPSRISALSSGEFVGMVADDPDCKIDLKAFHCSILNDHEALKKEQEGFRGMPVIRKLDNGMVQRNYLQIKQDVQDIIQSEMKRVLGDPGLSHLVIKK